MDILKSIHSIRHQFKTPFVFLHCAVHLKKDADILELILTKTVVTGIFKNKSYRKWLDEVGYTLALSVLSFPLFSPCIFITFFALHFTTVSPNIYVKLFALHWLPPSSVSRSFSGLGFSKMLLWWFLFLVCFQARVDFKSRCIPLDFPSHTHFWSL